MSTTVVINEVPKFNLSVQQGDGPAVTLSQPDAPALTLSMSGPQGPTGATGAAGPNSVTSSTTSDGTGTLSLSSLSLSTPLPLASGGTNATTASAARTNLGLGTTDTPTFSNLTLNTGTITVPQPLAFSQTWNSTATFTALQMNITDSGPANAASLLMDLRVGGVSRFRVGSSSVFIPTSSNFSCGRIDTSGVDHVASGTTQYSTSLKFGSASSLAWMSGSTWASGSTDLILFRDATGTLAQRNGANAQEFRLYGTTNAGVTEYERLKLKYNSTTLSYQIGTEKGGTTTSARPLEFQTDGTTRMTIGATGTLTYSASQTGFFDISKTAQTGRESILRAKVSDSGNDAFHIYNATGVNNSFAPGFSGSRFSSNLFCVGFIAQTNSSNDNGTSPLMLFESRITDSESDPNNGNLSPISNRPLFAWQTFNSEKMRMLANGNLVLGATTAASRLTVTGGDAEVTDSASGIILKSPDGTRYRVKVANGGTLTVTAV